MAGAGAGSATLKSVDAVGAQLRILCYGDSLTAGYYNWGSEFYPYSQTLAPALATLLNAEDNTGPAAESDPGATTAAAGAKGVPAGAGDGRPSAAGISVTAASIGMSGWSCGDMAESTDERRCTDVCGVEGRGLAAACEHQFRDSGAPFDAVIIMAGTNDLGDGDADTAFASLKQLHERAHKLGCPTAAVSCPQHFMERRMERILAVREELAARLRAMAAELGPSRMTFVDGAALMPYFDVDDATRDKLWEDLHMRREGYAEFGRRVAAAIAPWLTTIEALPRDAAAEPRPRAASDDDAADATHATSRA